MKLLVIGRGRMGAMLEQTAQAAGDKVIGTYARDNLGKLLTLGKVADVVVDFSSPAALDAVLDYVRRTGTAYLSGVTGLTAEQLTRLHAAGSAAAVLHSANFSLGIAVFQRALSQISHILKPDFDIEITETHHNRKADAPSGTAKLLLDAIDPTHALQPVCGREGLCGARQRHEIGVHALRGGTVAGEHTVHFFGADEELSITHRATSRQIFVSGALHVAHLLPPLGAGVYDLQKILFRED